MWKVGPSPSSTLLGNLGVVGSSIISDECSPDSDYVSDFRSASLWKGVSMYEHLGWRRLAVDRS